MKTDRSWFPGWWRERPFCPSGATKAAGYDLLVGDLGGGRFMVSDGHLAIVAPNGWVAPRGARRINRYALHVFFRAIGTATRPVRGLGASSSRFELLLDGDIRLSPTLMDAVREVYPGAIVYRTPRVLGFGVALRCGDQFVGAIARRGRASNILKRAA